jgi:hypothetical protein
MTAHSDGFYLHQWLCRMQALEARLIERLPDTSTLPARAKALRTQVELALVSQGDVMLDQLLENVFLPQLDRLILDVRQALNLTQHARKVKGNAMTPRQTRLLEISTNPPEPPEVPLFNGSKNLKRDPSNREKIDDALSRLKAFLEA